MAKLPTFEPFPIDHDDPLAEEHRAVAAWVEDAMAKIGERSYYQEVDLKSLPSGELLVSGKPPQSRRYVLAAVAQTAHWDSESERVRQQGETEMQRVNAHHLPGWEQVWSRRRQAANVVKALMRRKLPLEEQDLLVLLNWCNAGDTYSSYHYPVSSLVKALERFTAESPPGDELHEAMKSFAALLRTSYDKDAKRLGTKVEQLYATAGDVVEDEPELVATHPLPQPAPAGEDGVLVRLKQLLGMLPVEELPESTVVGPDEFPLAINSPLMPEHQLLTAVIEEAIVSEDYYSPDLNKLTAGRATLALSPPEVGRVLLAAAERHIQTILKYDADFNANHWQARYAAAGCVVPLAHSNFELLRDGVLDALLYLSTRPSSHLTSFSETIAQLLGQVEKFATAGALTEGERFVFSQLRMSLIGGPPLGTSPDDVVRLTKLIGDAAQFCLVPGEVWADGVNDDFTKMDVARRRAWAALFVHMLTATTSRPNTKWLKAATALVDEIGGKQVQQALANWLPLVAQGQSRRKLGEYLGDARGAANTMQDENATCLRGLLWLIATLPAGEKLAREISGVALSAYKKVPGVGPRAVKVGNASIFALSQIASPDAVGQLAMLKIRVKFGTAQKEIEKAFRATAAALGLPEEQIEEMGVPTYGLEEGGRLEESLGDYRAELVVEGSHAQLNWFDTKGKQLKSVPAKVKKEHKDELKELKQSLKDIQGMLPAQRDRVDSMFLLQKSWPIDLWRERYLEHPLVGTIASRLLWCVDDSAALFIDGQPTDVHGKPITHGKTAEITLWHPVGHKIEAITAWRRRLEELEITQPFKQAHREVYLLTDAERNTGTYSNRFAAHVIRQHQFNALCAARGWKNRLRLMVDDSYAPPLKNLSQWNLRAEFWVESIGEDYGVDTNDSGVFLRLATDQVRFYQTEAAVNYAHASGGGYATQAAGPGQNDLNEPLPLEQIPPLVLSEIMRDVDLFVGVASVGNDPTWQDGGPEGRYRDYWHNYSFGELSGTATTRRQVLERLVPRLKIAERCSLSDRFLLVRGDKRTYKIHLGSGNILMEPNDQYLCIVPDARSRAKQDDLFLPFEGDNTLSIIISKAFLLAADTKIKDPTINQQIDR